MNLNLKIKYLKDKGLNIYMLVGVFKKRSKLKPDIPEEVIEAVCDEYIKRGDRINGTFPYFLIVLQQKSGEYFAKQNSEKINEKPNMQLLKDVFGGMK